MYKQSLQYSGPESCNADEYIYAHRCCKMCPTGQYVEKLCMRPHTQGVCVKCELGTFTAYANGLESCLVCSTCRAGNANGCEKMVRQSVAKSSVTEAGDELSSAPASTSHTSPGKEGSGMLPQSFEGSSPGDPSPYGVTPDTTPGACGPACPGRRREDERTESQDHLLECTPSD
ncbi:tumor necrosis factor receptor superfamily member 14-like [Cavia porcellus]|uniref:tumor necrosis factor receptor superfamily member 14-like n=1 Tax=Cavia porcellus TaxID=10141 RepID=UPI000661F7C1|nr:tumor necrosis factor receptor superfamily member 14-like isoform X1 [Cavia porcellus]XP_013006325.1 tumor necrosis factor receptor superfamily member 14-like isoform X1 [Cavia porcellus]